MTPSPKALAPNPATTPHPLHGFFITGTDTEIGKTCITAGLTRAFDDLGRYVTPIKSLAAGQTQDADGAWVNEDVALLHAAQRQGMTMDEVGPLQLRSQRWLGCNPPPRFMDIKFITNH